MAVETADLNESVLMRNNESILPGLGSDFVARKSVILIVFIPSVCMLKRR